MSWWALSEKKQTCTFVLRESVKLMPVSKWCCIVISATNVCNEVCGMSYTSIFSILLFLPQGDNLNYIIMLQHCCFCLCILFFKYSILVLLNFKFCEIKKIVGFFYLWRTVNNRGSFFRNFIEKKNFYTIGWPILLLAVGRYRLMTTCCCLLVFVLFCILWFKYFAKKVSCILLFICQIMWSCIFIWILQMGHHSYRSFN